MRTLSLFASLLVLMLSIESMARAEDKAPDSTTRSQEPTTWLSKVPPIELSHRPLEDVLKELRQKLPGFEYSLSRVNVPSKEPVLPNITTENLNLAQLIRLFESTLPGTKFSVASKGISSPLDSSATILSAGDAPQCEIIVYSRTRDTARRVQVFNLQSIIAHSAAMLREGNPAERDQQATDELLSTVQAAVLMADETPWPDMKIHAPTKSLLFKGSENQINTAARALEALARSAQQRDTLSKVELLEAENKRLQKQLEQLKTGTSRPNK